MAKEIVNYQEVYDFYQLCSKSKVFASSERIMELITTSL